MNATLQELNEYIDETYAEVCHNKEIKLEKQVVKALRMLRYWADKMEAENNSTFWYTLNVKIPYWERWIKKYKIATPSMKLYLTNQWDEYAVLRNKGKSK